MKLIRRPSPKYFKHITDFVNYNYTSHYQLTESMLNDKYDLHINSKNQLVLLDDDDYIYLLDSNSNNLIDSNANKIKVIKEAI